MRKITKESIEAFNSNTNFKKANTEVVVLNTVTLLRLHGNTIAEKFHLPIKALYISSCGWESNVTKERLNGISGVSITQKNHIWFLNGNQWNGSSIKIY